MQLYVSAECIRDAIRNLFASIRRALRKDKTLVKARMLTRAERRSSSIFVALVYLVLFVTPLLVTDNGSLRASEAFPQQKETKPQYVGEGMDVSPQKATNRRYTGAMAAAQQPTAKVPDVRGQTPEVATKILGDAKLKLGEVVFGSYDAAPGRVARQFPSVGEFVMPGASVNVWVAREPELPPPPPKQSSRKPPPGKQKDEGLVEVPDLRSHGERAAQILLALRGLQYGGAKKIPSEKEKPGNIFDQDPKPGTQVARGTSVRVAVAVGKPPEPTVEVPNLFHHNREEATGMLKQAGLQANDSDITEASSEEETGIVLSQYPSAGTQVPRGTSVSFVSSRQIERTLVLRPDPASVVPGKPVTFTAELDPPFPGALFQFRFGEGPGSGELVVPQATHEYSDDGDYYAFVIATLNGKELVSNRVLLPVHSIPLKVTLVPNRDRATTDDTIEFHAIVEPQPAPDNAEYTFNFGDGTLAQTSRSPDARHSYTQRKTYSAWVTVHTVHESLTASKLAHEHQFVSEPVQLSIVSRPPSAWAIIAAVATAILLAGAAAFSGYRSYMLHKVRIRVAIDTGKQRLETSTPPLEGMEVGFRAVHPPGQQALECRGPLWARIETMHE